MPKRSHSSIVWAKSRAVTRDLVPFGRAAARSPGALPARAGCWSGRSRRASDVPRYRSATARPEPQVSLRRMLLASISETLVNETSHFVREAGLPGIFVLMAISSALHPDPLRGRDAVRRLRRRRPARRAHSHAPHDAPRHRRSRACSGRWSARGSPTPSAAAGAWSCSNVTATSSTWARRRSRRPTAGSSATASPPCCSGA